MTFVSIPVKRGVGIVTMKHFGWVGLGLFALTAAGLWRPHPASGDAEKEKQSHVFELRIYTTEEGRLPDLHKRFRDHTMRIFKKHGMKSVAYWTPTDKENTLVYMLAHKSREAAGKSWDAFREDPEWQKVFKESRKDGPIVTKVARHFLSPTDYSPMK